MPDSVLNVPEIIVKANHEHLHLYLPMKMIGIDVIGFSFSIATIAARMT